MDIGSNNMTQDEWLALGIEKGWISKPFCLTHDVPDFTDEEKEIIDSGNDCCVGGLRLYER